MKQPGSGNRSLRDAFGFAGHARTSTQAFRLVRQLDASGVSGTGHVADGVTFADGATVLRWRGLHPTTTVFECLDDLIRIHGHGGTTHVVLDEPLPWLIPTEVGREALDE